MKYKFGLLGLALIGSALLPTGCNRTEKQPPQQSQYYQQDYEVWVGPGWYYGVYFSDEGRYRNWRRTNRGHGPYYRHRGRGGRYYYHGRGYRGGRGHYHGGGRRGGGGRGGGRGRR